VLSPQYGDGHPFSLAQTHASPPSSSTAPSTHASQITASAGPWHNVHKSISWPQCIHEVGSDAETIYPASHSSQIWLPLLAVPHVAQSGKVHPCTGVTSQSPSGYNVYPVSHTEHKSTPFVTIHVSQWGTWQLITQLPFPSPI